MEIAYWVLAGLLAIFFLYAGGLKLIRSKEQLEPTMGWVDTVPMNAVRAIGAIEVLGAVGLILPPLTGVAPVLASVAAGGFVILQVSATALHLSRGEAKDTWLNVVLIAIAAVVLWLSTSIR